jgi:hypothetical protein
VERAAIAVGPDIELQGLQLDAALVGHVLELERREIRLSGLRAQAGEFRDRHANRVVAFRRRIRETFRGWCWVESSLYFTLRASSTATRQCLRLPKVQEINALNKTQDCRLQVLRRSDHITFPSSLTGVVGPNGCGKSNIIDAVRWVMGEISAKHLRGESMADVIFNGSAARKPLGSASVELVFDNSDGKIGGAYANYNEVALRAR